MEPSALAIRTATPADLDAVVSLLLAQLREHAIGTPADDVVGVTRRLLRRPHRARFLLASEAGVAVGVAALSFVWPIEHGRRAAWLEELYVLAERRAHGIGARLLAAVCDLVTAEGGVAIDLEVDVEHARAANLYRRAGFTALTRTRFVRRLEPRSSEARQPQAMTGGCFCGALRYALAGAPELVTHCHCSMCRRVAGAPLVTWATYPAGALRWTQGTPAALRSSAKAVRTFCGRCGTPLTFAEVADPSRVDVTVATMDHPETFRPQAHIWTSSQLGWAEVDDDLPRLPRGTEG